MTLTVTVPDLHTFLAGETALIVHFSGLPKETGYSISFPNDLQDAIVNGQSYRLSCSLIKPTDHYSLIQTQSNATGKIGVILDLRDSASLIDVAPCDVGTGVDANGRKLFIDRDISIDDCTKSLSGRATYNEWGVRNYITRGLFVFDPNDIQVMVYKKTGTNIGVTRDGEQGIWDYQQLSLMNLADAFPGIPVYTFLLNRLAAVHPVSGLPLPVSHAAIYR